jgi:hypothetical protein
LSQKALEESRALGVEEELIEFDGLTPQMILALAKDGVLTLHDFATCADWELAGGWSQIDGKRIKEDGLLEAFDMSLEEAQSLVMTARVIVGIIDASDVVFEGEEDGALYDEDEAEDEAEDEIAEGEGGEDVAEDEIAGDEDVAEDEPAEGDSAESDEITEGEPAEGAPAEDQPAEDEPAADEPAGDQPAAEDEIAPPVTGEEDDESPRA